MAKPMAVFWDSTVAVRLGIVNLGLLENVDTKGVMEPMGVEPTTSCMPCKRSPN